MSPAPRIGIVVTDAYAPEDPDHDTPPLLAELRRRGADASAVVWHAADDLDGFDLLVLRSPWDYPDRLAEFVAWLDRADAVTRVRNPSALVRWNLDKHYLRDLETRGIPVVPTAYAADADAVRAALHSGPDRVVVKPAMSAAARDTGLFDAADPAAARLAEAIIARGGVAMIQPEIPELTAGHEKALYAVEGRFTHAIAKGPLLADGGGLRGGVYVENPVAVEASTAEQAFAADVLAAVAAATGTGTPLYARVDTVDSAEFGLVVLEVELIEPAFNLHVSPQVTALLADAILRAV